MDVLDRADVLNLFLRQHCVAGVAQLEGLGVSPSMIGRARRRRTVYTLLPGIVALTGQPLDFHARGAALLLHCGQPSYLSGQTAGALYGLRKMNSRVVEVATKQNRRIVMPPWGRHHRSSWLHPSLDMVQRDDGLWVARPMRMLFRLAALFNDHRFERAAEDAWHLELVTPRDAAEWLDEFRRRGRTGVARFERWLQQTEARPRPSQSGFELDVLDVLLAAGLPPPVRQHPLTLASGEVIHLDIAWPRVRLGVEPGHSWWHGGNLRMRADQARQRACDAVGWRVLAYDESARDDLAAVGREVRQIYDARRTSLHPT